MVACFNQIKRSQKKHKNGSHKLIGSTFDKPFDNRCWLGPTFHRPFDQDNFTDTRLTTLPVILKRGQK
ncbi:hypothetical protein AB3S75_008107 [Citrus x aurantiifolia]